MNARKFQEDRVELPPITRAALQRHRDRLLALMSKVSTSDHEDFKVVREEYRKFHGLVHSVPKLPEEHWFEIDVKQYLFDFQQTEEHRNFDKVRTYFHHQTDSYKAWKKQDNRRRYEEQLRRERSTPQAKARAAALTRRRRRRERYEEVREDLRRAFFLGEHGAALQVLWDTLEDAYEAVVSVEVSDFQGDGYGAPWPEVKAALTQKLAAEAKTVTPLHRKRMVAEAAPVERRLEDIMAGDEPTIQELMEFLGDEP